MSENPGPEPDTRDERSIARRSASPVLLVLGCALLFLANVFVWANSTLFDSTEFSSTVSDVLDQQDVQSRIAEVLAQQVLDSGEVQARLREDLPDRAQFLAPVLTAQIDELLQRVAVRVLQSDLVGNVRDDVISGLHERLVAILEADNTRLQVQGSSLVLDMREPFVRLLDRLDIATPAAQGGGDSGRGQIVLLQNTSGLKQASWAVKNRHAITTVFLVASVVSLAGSIAARPDRLRGLEAAGFGVAVVGLIVLLVLFVSNQVLESQAEERIVARELVKALESNLRWQSIGLIILGACLVALTDTRIRDLLMRSEARAGGVLSSLGASKTALVAVGVAAAGLLLVAR